jgi:arylsulfate sulfotransferase
MEKRACLFGMVVSMCLVSLGCGSGDPKSQFSYASLGNPTGSVAATQHPLVAQYNLVLPQFGSTAWVEFGTDTNYGKQTSVTAPSTGFGQSAPILVAGMKQMATYHMRAHVNWSGGSWVDQDHTFTTGAIPPNGGGGIDGATGLVIPKMVITRPNSGLVPSPGIELFSLVGSPNMLQVFAADLDGNVIWYYPGAGIVKPMQNGHFSVNSSAALLEIDLAGNIIRQVDVAGVNQSLKAQGYTFSIINFHHDQLTLPNGHWIALSNVYKDFTNLPGFPGVTKVLGDVVLDLDPDGNVVWAWSGFDHLDINRHPMGLPPFSGGADWTHANALVYTPDGNLLLSMRNQNWILKLDYQNGQGAGDILWRLGEDGDFTLVGGDPSQWFYAQHYPNPFSTNGSQTTMAIWDNGNLRPTAGGYLCNGTTIACFSRATIFQIDESTMVANLVWQDTPGLYSGWGGSIGVLGKGNVEFDLCAAFAFPAARITEVTQGSNPQVVWQLDLSGEYAYRGYRIPSLYPGVTWQ